jgi:hypothetical protein
LIQLQFRRELVCVYNGCDLNFDPLGTSTAEGTLLPARNQTHLTLEPTVGLLPEFAIGFMFLNAWEPGQTPQYAGWRVLPH